MRVVVLVRRLCGKTVCETSVRFPSPLVVSLWGSWQWQNQWLDWKLKLSAKYAFSVPQWTLTWRLKGGLVRRQWLDSVKQPKLRNIHFIFVPGHAVVWGNERADRFAGMTAVEIGRARDRTNMLHSTRDAGRKKDLDDRTDLDNKWMTRTWMTLDDRTCLGEWINMPSITLDDRTCLSKGTTRCSMTLDDRTCLGKWMTRYWMTIDDRTIGLGVQLSRLLPVR